MKGGMESDARMNGWNGNGCYVMAGLAGCTDAQKDVGAVERADRNEWILEREGESERADNSQQ